MRSIVTAFATLAIFAVSAGQSQAQVATSHHTGVAPAIIGTIPVRAGLFGLRTDSIPVFGSPIAAAPVMSTPYQVGRPVTMPSPNGVATPHAPNPVYAPAPAYGYGYNSFYTGSFFPGAVMTMQ